MHLFSKTIPPLRGYTSYNRNPPAPCLSDLWRIPPFFKTLITLRTPGRNTAPPVSSHITQRSLAHLPHSSTMPKQNSAAPLATGALARQKQRSICFCLDFLLHFFIKKKVETLKRLGFCPHESLSVEIYTRSVVNLCVACNDKTDHH